MALNTQKCRMKWLTTMTMVCSLLSMSKLTYGDTVLGTSTITFDFSQPTCNITVPSEVDLGWMTAGQNVSGLKDIPVTVQCDDTTAQYDVYMTSQNHLSGDGRGMNLARTDDGSDSGVILSLEGPAGNQFTTDESHPVAVISGSGSTTEAIKPSLTVPSGIPSGKIEGTVIFKLAYQT